MRLRIFIYVPFFAGLLPSLQVFSQSVKHRALPLYISCFSAEECRHVREALLCRKMFPKESLSKKYLQVIEDHKRKEPAKPPVVRYYNGGFAINGEFFPYEQTEIENM